MRTNRDGLQIDDYFDYSARNMRVKKEDALRFGINRIFNMTIKNDYGDFKSTGNIPDALASRLKNKARNLRMTINEVVFSEASIKMDDSYNDSSVLKISFVIFKDMASANLFNLRTGIGDKLFKFNSN